MVRACQADALKFAAAAVHARRVGTRNPAGLFAKVVRGGLWAYISLDDEARGRVVAHRLLPERSYVQARQPGRPRVAHEPVEASPEYLRRVRSMILASLAESASFHSEDSGRTPLRA